MSFSSISSALSALSAFDLDFSEGTDCRADLAAIAADPTNTAEERAAARAILANWSNQDFWA
jgi:hypothetical protein